MMRLCLATKSNIGIREKSDADFIIPAWNARL